MFECVVVETRIPLGSSKTVVMTCDPCGEKQYKTKLSSFFITNGGNEDLF